MPNSCSEIPWDLSLWRGQACQTLSNVLDISNAAAWLASDLLNVLALLSDTQVYTGNKKRHIFLGDQQIYYLQVL